MKDEIVTIFRVDGKFPQYLTQVQLKNPSTVFMVAMPSQRKSSSCSRSLQTVQSSAMMYYILLR